VTTTTVAWSLWRESGVQSLARWKRAEQINGWSGFAEIAIASVTVGLSYIVLSIMVEVSPLATRLPFDPASFPLVYLPPTCMDPPLWKRTSLCSGFRPQNISLDDRSLFQARLCADRRILLTLALWDYFFPDTEFLHQLSQVSSYVSRLDEINSDECFSFSERTWLKAFVGHDGFLAGSTFSS